MAFLNPDDTEVGAEFLQRGYVIRPAADAAALRSLHDLVASHAATWLGAHSDSTDGIDLASSHRVVGVERVNDLRLALFAAVNARADSRKSFFEIGRPLLEQLVGNELAMQTKVNLSIQQPGDPSSVLDIHSDVWTGDSPFQVVQWVPLTDANGTNAMFFLPPEPSREAHTRVRCGELRSMMEVHAAYRTQITIIEMRYGEVLVFDSNCLHGNQLNTTTTSRWSLNCRFVSLLAPATNPERRLGSYYTPITTRPATRMGLRALAETRPDGDPTAT